MKSTPNLPASSRMQAPSMSKPSVPNAKAMVKSGSVAKKVVGKAKGAGMKSKTC